MGLRAGSDDIEMVVGQIGRDIEGLPARDAGSPRWMYPPDSRRRTASGRSAPDGTTTSMSMIGFAARPGTAVLPTCSITAPLPTRRTCSRSFMDLKKAGQAASYATTVLASGGLGRWRPAFLSIGHSVSKGHRLESGQPPPNAGCVTDPKPTQEAATSFLDIMKPT